MEKSIKRRIGVLAVLGMLVATALAIPVTSDSTDTDWDRDNAEGEVYVTQTTDRAGIGDTDPDFKLEVAGSSGSGYFGVSSAAGNDGDIFVIASGGNVGIGITTFSTKFHVLQTAAADAFRVDDMLGDTTPFVIDQDGNVGIGTPSPSHKLEISDSDNTANRAGLYVSQTAAILGRGYGSYITKTGGSTTNVAGYFSASGAMNNYGLIVANGDVGIGTTSPSTTLHVNGDVAFGDGSELTISSGEVTATDSYHTIDTEGNAGSDDLVTIYGGSVAGEILIIRAEHTDRDVVAIDNTGNLQLNGNFEMNNAEDTLTLIFDGSNWLEISRSDNGA